MKVSEIKIGETYNGVKVLGLVHKRSKGYECLCLCPICEKEFRLDYNKVGQRSCCASCIPPKYKDLSGRRFGSLVVVRHAGFVNKTTYWECKCDCGTYKKIRASYLLSGHTQTCGCACGRQRKVVSKDFDFKQPLPKHPLWCTWYGIKMRCENPNDPNFKNYGGRGIRLCNHWNGQNGFENFVNDMGERPNGTTVDRIDVNGDYSPENCRWATQKEQCNNQRKNVIVVYKGEQITLTQFCEIAGLRRKTLYSKIRKGVDINFLVLNSEKYRSERWPKTYDGHINHNRVVSEEVMKMLEEKSAK